jgi:hypothetical protein
MNEQNASSFDLLQAQQLLNMLIPRPGSAVKEKPVQLGVPNYSNLSASNLAQRVRPSETTDEIEKPRVVEVEPEPVLQKFDSWEDCIAWCMSSTRAEAAFVVDSQGFVIASRGRIPSQGFEGAGAELICSIEQLERIAPEAGRILCVDMDFDKRRIVGFVAFSDEAATYVVGLVAPEPLRNETKHKITQQIVNNLPNLD